MCTMKSRLELKDNLAISNMSRLTSTLLSEQTNAFKRPQFQRIRVCCFKVVALQAVTLRVRNATLAFPGQLGHQHHFILSTLSGLLSLNLLIEEAMLSQ